MPKNKKMLDREEIKAYNKAKRESKLKDKEKRNAA